MQLHLSQEASIIIYKHIIFSLPLFVCSFLIFMEERVSLTEAHAGQVSSAAGKFFPLYGGPDSAHWGPVSFFVAVTL